MLELHLATPHHLRTNFTSTPPLNTDEARLIATLPLNADGHQLKALRLAMHWSQDKFAAHIGVTTMWLRMFEKGDMPLYKCRTRTLVLLACALIKIGVRLTKDGWELLPKGGGDG